MSKKNAYVVNVSDDKLKFLLEFLFDSTDGITSYYYEVVFKIARNIDKLEFIGVDSYREIYDSLTYIYKHFKGKEINRFKVDDRSTEYIVEQTIKFAKDKSYDIFDDLDDSNFELEKNYVKHNDNNNAMILKYELMDNKKNRITPIRFEAIIAMCNSKKQENDNSAEYLANREIIKDFLCKRK